jgi:hypothetical protein
MDARSFESWLELGSRQGRSPSHVQEQSHCSNGWGLFVSRKTAAAANMDIASKTSITQGTIE